MWVVLNVRTSAPSDRGKQMKWTWFGIVLAGLENRLVVVPPLENVMGIAGNGGTD